MNSCWGGDGMRGKVRKHIICVFVNNGRGEKAYFWRPIQKMIKIIRFKFVHENRVLRPVTIWWFSSTEVEKHFRHANGPASSSTRVFGVLLIVMQVAVCVVYAFVVKMPDRTEANVIKYLYSLAPIVTCVGFFLLVLFGILSLIQDSDCCSHISADSCGQL